MTTIPTLSHGRVTIRPLRLRDTRDLDLALASNRSWLRTWEATNPSGHVSTDVRGSIRALQANARAGLGLPFAMELDGRFVGQLNVSGITYGSLASASIGYWVVEDAAGHNVTPISVALAVDHCFRAVGVHRIEICIRPENAPSLRVVEKLGFRVRGAPSPVHPHQRRLARPLLLRARRRRGPRGRPRAVGPWTGAARTRRRTARRPRRSGAADHHHAPL